MSMDVDTITDDQIAEIADRMTEEGRKVSPVSVWSEVQGGSIVAIAAALQRWREAREPDTLSVQVQPAGLPENATEAMMSAAGRLWAAAHDEAQRVFSQRLSLVNHQLDAAFAERDEALVEYQRATEEVGTGRERIIALTNALSAAEHAAARLTDDLVRTNVRAETAERRVDELAQHASEVDRKLEQTKAALETERNARDELATIVMVKDEEIAEANLQRDESRQEVARLGEAIQQKSSALSASEHEVARLASELQTVTARADVLDQRAWDAETSLNLAQTALVDERAVHEELAAVVASKNDEIARVAHARDELIEVATTKSDEIARLTREHEAQVAVVASKSDEITKLGQERDALNAAVALNGDEITRIEQERDDARQEVLSLGDAYQQKTTALSAAESEAARLAVDLSTANSRAETAENRGEELAQRELAVNATLDATKATLDEERKAREELTAVVANKTDEIARIARDRDELIDLAATRGDEITKITQERDALNTDVANKRDQITRTAQERDAARQEVTMLNSTLEEKTGALAASEASAAQLRAELSTSVDRAETAETQVAELEMRASEDDARLELAKTSLEEERKAREELNTVVASQSDEIARIGQEHDEVRREAANLRDAFKEKLNALNASEETGTRLAIELATAATRADTAETHLAELTQRAAEEGARLQKTTASLDEERKAREASDVAVAEKSEELARITQEHNEVRRELATLSETHRSQAEEVSQLTEKANAAASQAEAATTQANASLARIAGLETELEEAHKSLATERQTSVAGLDEASAQRNEVQRITKELGEARERLGALSQAKATADTELTRLAHDASAARERAEAAEERAAELAQRIAKLNEARAAETPRDQQVDVRAGEADQTEEVAALHRQISAQNKLHQKAFNELRASAEQWVAHAKELKQRLGQASERVLFIDARSTGEVALVRRLSSELERLRPDHELVSREMQQKLISSTMAQQLAMKGYRYDPSTAAMSKVEG